MIESLWHAHRDDIFRYLDRRLNDAEQANDLTQEVFLTVLRQGEALETIDNVEGWLYRVARNRLIDHTRKTTEDRLPHNAEPVREDDREDDRDAVGHLVGGIGLCLRNLIAEYDAMETQVLLDVFTGRVTQKEAAIEQGIPYSTFKSRVQKARSVITERFQDVCCEALIRNRHGDVINCRPVTTAMSSDC